jgi:hypothetical protein
MYDRDDDQNQVDVSQESLDADITEFKRLVYLLGGVCKNLTDKGDHFDTTLSQITFVIEKFEERLKQYPQVEKRALDSIAYTLQTESRQAAKLVADTVGSNIHEAATKQVDQTVKKLESTAYQINQSFIRYENSRFWLIIGGILLCLLSGFSGGVWTYSMFPEDKFTKAQLRQMEDGELIEKAWKKLSKKEQDKILALANGREYQEEAKEPAKSKKKKKKEEVYGNDGYNE